MCCYRKASSSGAVLVSYLIFNNFNVTKNERFSVWNIRGMNHNDNRLIDIMKGRNVRNIHIFDDLVCC